MEDEQSRITEALSDIADVVLMLAFHVASTKSKERLADAIDILHGVIAEEKADARRAKYLQTEGATLTPSAAYLISAADPVKSAERVANTLAVRGLHAASWAAFYHAELLRFLLGAPVAREGRPQ